MAHKECKNARDEGFYCRRKLKPDQTQGRLPEQRSTAFSVVNPTTIYVNDKPSNLQMEFF